MARMRPQELSASMRSDPGRAAEVRLYDDLAEQLSDKWSVWHGCAWLGTTHPGSVPMDGEIDFVVAHGSRGILVIELKGGLVSYDARQSQWFSRDRNGVEHKIEPFEQVMRNKYALMEKIKSVPGWRDRWVEINHAVVFADCERPTYEAAPNAPPRIIIGSDDMQQLERRLLEVFHYWAGQSDRKPGDMQPLLSTLDAVLGRDIQLRNPLHLQVQKSEEEIVGLTQEQHGLLDFLSRVRKARIGGCAGSGKTLLAVEKARRLAAEGHRTLLTCFNRPLGDFLEERCGDTEGLDVMTFHRLCELAGGDRLPSPEDVDDVQALFEERYPEELLKEAESGNPDFKYDAIVVDEGQDFAATWWVALEACLSDQKFGIFYIFFDSNQVLYSERGQLPEMPFFSLNKNIRNTRSIFKLVAARYHGDEPPESGGPAGRAVALHSYSDVAGLKRELGQVLRKLVNDEGIDPADVAVLTPRSLSKSDLSGASLPGTRLKLSEKPEGKGEIRLSSIHRFKGLESPVVVVAEVDESAATNEALLYVAFSRARSHMVLIAHEKVIDLFKKGQ